MKTLVRDVLLVVAFVFLFLVWGLKSLGAEEQNFDVQVVHKLSQMLNVEPPKNIIIERVSQKRLLGEMRGSIMQACMMGRVERFQYCADVAQVRYMFVQGLWIEQGFDTLHIKIYKNAGVDALIHEYCHWYLHYRTAPSGLINNHEVLIPLATSLLVSDEFIAWLEREEKGGS